MSQEDNREQEHLNPDLTDEEIEKLLNPEEEEGDDEPDVEALQEKLKEKDSLIRQMHARAKKAEASKKEAPKKIEQKKEEDEDDIRQTVQQLKLAEQKRQFGFENNLSPEETDYLFKIDQNPNKEMLEDPFVKGGLEAIRAKKRDSQNTPSLSGRSPRFELPKKKDLSADEKQQHFEEYMRNKKKK